MTTAMQHSRHREVRQQSNVLEPREAPWQQCEQRLKHKCLLRCLLGKEAERRVKEEEQPRKVSKSAGSRTLDSQSRER